jgi:hypothetical protein
MLLGFTVGPTTHGLRQSLGDGAGTQSRGMSVVDIILRLPPIIQDRLFG